MLEMLWRILEKLRRGTYDECMTPGRYRFASYELDLRQFELRDVAGERIPLEPQVFEVLAYLVEHRERIVPKSELLDHIWPERYVSEAALNSRLMAARKAIGDNGRDQRLLRTLHGRGYRFIGEVEEVGSVGREHRLPVASALAQPDMGPATLPGRAQDLAHLHAALERAASGVRQLVFVTGEAGIGKTALIRTFLAGLPPGGCAIAFGQCIEQSGAGEAFLPFLDALSALNGDDPTDEVSSLLRQLSPTWALQMPGVLPQAEVDGVRLATLGAQRGRMLREALEVLDALARNRPLILTLEDLHWSDTSTVDLLGAVARRPEPARLLVIGTYRPQDTGVEMLQRLKAELRIRGLCSELAVGRLGQVEVTEIAERRLPGVSLSPELAAQLTRRCGGNPLFLGSLLDHLISQGVLQAGPNELAPEMMGALQEVPGDLRDLLRLQHSRLSAFERGLLEAAAVAGQEFKPGMLAQLVEEDEEAVERACEDLTASGPFLATRTRHAVREDLQPGYAFVHDLHRETIEAAMPRTKRVRLHLRVGNLLETQSNEGKHVRAAEVAEHFELGGDLDRAVLYRERRLRRHSHAAATRKPRGTSGQRFAWWRPATCGTPPPRRWPSRRHWPRGSLVCTASACPGPNKRGSGLWSSRRS
jgi:DNA-binding winged helix-turn-helix (wHTH) protein